MVPKTNLEKRDRVVQACELGPSRSLSFRYRVEVEGLGPSCPAPNITGLKLDCNSLFII
jgi:hypothetical protein